MRVVLSSDITVVRLAVFAEMAWMARRPELGLLCRAARDAGKRITGAVVQSVLPGLEDAGATNVIAWCSVLGLCDERGALTALGADVAERDEAPVPEQGVYGLWLAEHPVIGRRVLAVERLSSSREQRLEHIEPLPVGPDRGRLFRSVVDPKERFLVRDLPSNHGEVGCLVGETRAACRLRWTLDFDADRDQWQLEGTIEVPQSNYAMRPMQHEPESDGLDLRNLANTWGIGPLSEFGRWRSSERRLAVSFDSLAEDEVDSFRKSLSLRSIEVPGKGSYENVTVEDVPVGPASSADAQRWAMSRLDRHLASRPAYRSRAEVRALFAELTEGTPLERFSPELPAHDEMLSAQGREVATDSARFWALAAPVDLAPYPVATEDLGPFRVGAPAEKEIASAPGVVRVPYRGGWSMRQFVDRLLGGVAPRRVLLCDRYVRGTDNVGTLKLLVQTVRALEPSAGIEVWTGEEEADFKQIQGITGSPTRGYRQVFGSNLPHDRYVLVVPAQGAGFGWHMSNSPLHARADIEDATPQSPLRWKDLLGTRVSADELEPALRQWLNGGSR